MLINKQIQYENVENPMEHLPSVSVDAMVMMMRVDKSLGTERIASYVMHAYDIIYRQLPCDMQDPVKVTQSITRGTCYQGRTYIRAVMHEAAALMSDDHLDFDTTGQGQVREDLSKSDKLRRIVSHCIADLKGQSRNRIRLL